jgi:hypothetical protein
MVLPAASWWLGAAGSNARFLPWMESRCLLPRNLQRGFDLVLLLVSWRIRRERNSRVFDNVSTTAEQARHVVPEEGDEWICAGFTAVSDHR